MDIRANIMSRAARHDRAGVCRLGGAGRDGIAKEGIRLVDMMMNDADHRRRGLVPSYLQAYPCLELLPKKICHFLNDYAHDEFQSLRLDISNGEHKELGPADVQNLLDRMHPMTTLTGPAEVAIFGCLTLRSEGRNGSQKIRCSPVQEFYGYHRQVHNPGSTFVLVCNPLYIHVYSCI